MTTLDHVLVVDVESTCREGSPPPGEVSEIIEIGVCPLEVGSGRRGERRSVLVRPARPSVSPFCTRLTTLTQADVDGGIPFAEACALLRKEFRSDRRVWASYGDYDRRMFERQCADFGVKYPFGPRHINVKTLFALVHALPREIGMAEAVRLTGQELDGTHHRGHDDAFTIAGLLRK
ncbi:Inhibitor of the KinA pathway to sporulation, predicted exonuclease [Lentzea xinjiangensis]|uniref:Inhibitor of the KinA pathway to sporulation, predicted exonuclease n=1 Tax=Lentzea xinjiangensis TaxID=402600 RepID=A0A1H9N9K0_9PSEU|nr:3'-5' exonuclease [Lentzea xinjiangensis]SER32578.1 Inhibitor of the KinA pathway to sporulation, predicted exonuclease [Lentzea xinjiangensis]